jgi:hypothetical protein
MDIGEFVAQVPGFDGLPPRDKIRLLAWYLHAHRNVEVIDNAQIRDCFRQLNIASPDVSIYLPRMADGKPSVVAVSALLSGVPAKVPDLLERAFLEEALSCYRVRAFRATIVMVWNLSFDHLLRWIMSDAARLAAFNAAIVTRYPKTGVVIGKRDDFDELKEAETIEVCRTAKLLSKNVVEILREKLKRRNAAAHPSSVSIGQHQVDDVISDLVNNVVLTLS